MIISNLIGIVADDLTGANDTALQFNLRGSNTKILLGCKDFSPEKISSTQTWAISTETRNVGFEEAYEKVKDATQMLVEKLNLEYFYKKIDSTLRGNIAIETIAMMQVLQCDCAVIIPAFPAEGRITVGGYQILKGIPIERTEMARDPHSPILDSYIPDILETQLVENSNLIGQIELKTVIKGAGPILQALNDLVNQGRKLIVVDATSITDIEQIVLATNKSSNKVLLAGTAATAQVLGNIWLPENEAQHVAVTIPELPKFVVSGSATNLTASQIEKLEKSDEFENTYFISLTLQNILDGVSEELVERIVSNLGKNNVVVLHTSKLLEEFDGFSDDCLNSGLTKTTLAEKITDFLAEVTKSVVEKKDLILITLGGETSYKCCNAINSTQLQLIAEVAPAIALSLDSKAQWIVTKSGNLGNSNTLIDILKYFENHE